MNENQDLSRALRDWAAKDQLPPSWPQASRIWWRSSVLQKLRAEQEDARRSRRSWIPVASLAALTSLFLVALNLVIWLALDPLADAWRGENAFVETPMGFLLGMGFLIPMLVGPLLAWLGLSLGRLVR